MGMATDEVGYRRGGDTTMTMERCITEADAVGGDCSTHVVDHIVVDMYLPIRAMRCGSIQLPFPRSVSIKHLVSYKEHLSFIDKSNIHGSGIGAGRDFERGELVVDYHGRHVAESDAAEIQWFTWKALGDLRTCLFHVRDGLYIDASVLPTIGRIMNHSCEPNCIALSMPIRDQGRPRYVALFASRDIRAGEELTFDYQCAVPLEPCNCGAPSCHGMF